MVSARVQGLQRFRQRIAQALPDSVKREVVKANDKSADEFMNTVRRIIPQGDDEAPELISTLTKRQGDPEYGGLGVIVSIGGPEAPYPLHLEAGHKAPDGSHVPPKPFWNPAKRVSAKRTNNRAKRAASKAIKALANGGA